MKILRTALYILAVLYPLQSTRAAEQWLTMEGSSQGIGKGQHIVFVTGEEYYRSEEGMCMFAQLLSRHHGFKCTVLFAISIWTISMPLAGKRSMDRAKTVSSALPIESVGSP